MPPETWSSESPLPSRREFLDPDWQEHAPFLRAIRHAADEDSSPVLIFADWWEDQGRFEQAALLRLRVESETLPPTHPRHHESRVQADRLVRVIMERTGSREPWSNRVEPASPWARLATLGLIARWRYGCPDMISWGGSTPMPDLFQNAIDLAPLTGLEILSCDRSGFSRLRTLKWPSPLRRLSIPSGDHDGLRGDRLVQLLDTWNSSDSLVELSLPVEILLGPDEPVGQLVSRLPRGLKRLRLTSTANHLDEAARPLGDAGLARLLDWEGLEKLEELALTHQELTDHSALRLALSPALRGLRHLDLSFNLIGNRGVHALSTSGYLEGLRTLRLAGNALGNAAARSIGSNSPLGNLHHLDLSANHLGDSGLHFLLSSEFLTELSVLEIGGNRMGLKAEGFPGWGRLDGGPRILRLDVSYNPVDPDRGVSRIFESPVLQDLVIWEVKGLDLSLLAEALVHGERLPRLRRLDARDARLPDSLAEAWTNSRHGQLDLLRGSVVGASFMGASI